MKTEPPTLRRFEVHVSFVGGFAFRVEDVHAADAAEALAIARRLYGGGSVRSAKKITVEER